MLMCSGYEHLLFISTVTALLQKKHGELQGNKITVHMLLRSYQQLKRNTQIEDTFTGNVLAGHLSVIIICLCVVRFSLNPPQIWSSQTSETLVGVIKKTEYCEDSKTNLKLIGQDIIIMSEGSGFHRHHNSY